MEDWWLVDLGLRRGITNEWHLISFHKELVFDGYSCVLLTFDQCEIEFRQEG